MRGGGRGAPAPAPQMGNRPAPLAPDVSRRRSLEPALGSGISAPRGPRTRRGPRRPGRPPHAPRGQQPSRPRPQPDFAPSTHRPRTSAAWWGSSGPWRRPARGGYSSWGAGRRRASLPRAPGAPAMFRRLGRLASVSPPRRPDSLRLPRRPRPAVTCWAGRPREGAPPGAAPAPPAGRALRPPGPPPPRDPRALGRPARSGIALPGAAARRGPAGVSLSLPHPSPEPWRWGPAGRARRGAAEGAPRPESGSLLPASGPARHCGACELLPGPCTPAPGAPRALSKYLLNEGAVNCCVHPLELN